MRDKFLGCVLGAAVGDAMGAATETMSTSEIIKTYGARVTSFLEPVENNIAYGRRAGQVTDAFSIAYYLTESIIENNGKADRKTGENALIEWGNSEFFDAFAGMTTRKVVKRLNDRKKTSEWDRICSLGNTLFKGNYYALSSNGAACKAYPAGLLHPGNIDAAIADAVELTMASHDDPLSISGACAVAAAVSAGLTEGATVESIVNAGLYGSKKGETLARDHADIWVYPGPSVTKRMKKTIELAMKAEDAEVRVNSIRELIGSGPAIAESVPAAFGIFVVENGDLMKCIYDAVNIGDETSAIAEIIGAIAGTYRGASCITEGYLDVICRENDMDIESQVDRLMKLT